LAGSSPLGAGTRTCSGAKRDDDFGSGCIGQHVLAHLVVTGAYDRHLRRQRTAYGMRRQALVASLATELPDWQVRGSQAGLHLWIEPPGPVREGALVAAALARDLLVLGMSTMCRSVEQRGLVLGFARLRTSDAPVVARRLAEAVRAAADGATADTAAPYLPSPELAARLGTTGVDFFPAGTGAGREPPLVPDRPDW
jgi:DNA-binding transcriptional MocR family regulator